MRITRLYLRGYRTFEDELELELPAGLVGIYGVNGAGKSALIESIRWTLYGKARTPIGEVRTTGINTDCITEVEFEHESHLYLVRRTITGANNTVKAEVHADRQLVAATVSDVARYVHSVIGMDDQSFRASVFAEQKQIAAFSNTIASKRRDLVLRLLGITPLDDAKAAAAKDARELAERFQRVRDVLPDLDALHASADDVRAAAELAETAVEERATAAAAARVAAEAALGDVSRLDALRQARDEIVQEGKVVAAERDAAAIRVAERETELADLATAEARLAELVPDAEGLDAAAQRLASVREVVRAGDELAALPAVDPPPPPDEVAAAAAREAAESAAAALAEVGGLLQAAQAELTRAQEAATRTGELSGEGACPVCGQALGDAFERVQAHRAAEVAGAQARLAELTSRRSTLATEAADARGRAEAADQALRSARAAQATYEQVRARRDAAERRLAEAAAGLEPPVADGELDLLVAEVARRRAAADGVLQLRTRLERRPQLETELLAARQQVQEAEDRRQNLLEKVKAMGFDPAALDAARARAEDARAALDDAVRSEQAARHEAVRLRTQAEGAAKTLVEAEKQHQQVTDLSDESRHVDRLSKLLHAFRNEVVGSIGPRLATQAAELFAELTDHEYDRLEVDPESYELQISDAGRVFGMDRFSGSEVDLANLALRVAISEHVRFQSGGAVGLLVLDEVFGPLDSDRKERMLLALERLKGRFRQVLVVTHDQEIKEQLPHAIEVVKLAPRRATARLLHA